MGFKSRMRLNRRKIAFSVVVAFVVAGGIALWSACRGTPRGPVKPVTKPLRPPVEVALANRTLCATGFPVRFCEQQTASARSTAPYVVVLADGVSKVEALAAVRACGARVVGPLPPRALLVETSVFALGKMSVDPHFTAAAEWLPEDKVDARLKPLLESEAATLDVTIVALAPSDVEGLVNQAVAQGGEKVNGCLNGKSSVTVKLPRMLVAKLAKRGDVRWLEPFKRPKLLNDAAVGSTAMNVRTVWDAHGLTGAGQLVTTSDSGIDTGDFATMHADLRNRVAGIGVVPGCYSYDANGHGTHTAGSIVGDGTMSDGLIRGTAYGARLWAWFCGGTDEYIYTPDECGELFRPTGRAEGAFIHSASWGKEDAGAYDEQSRDMDEYVWEHPDFLPVIANGNAGSARQTVGSPATAKNVLSVGATQSPRSANVGVITDFSSRGPCADGRIKPDLCSPGAYIVSTRSYCANRTVYSANTNYVRMSGTSMATPLTAGAAALVRQWLVERRGFTNAVPTAALVKAVLTGGAKGASTPDNVYGWGRVDLGESLYPSNRAVRLVDRVPFFDGVDVVAGSVTLTNAAPLDVQLVWIDYPATAGASQTLVNDLDLIVSNKTTGAVWYGNDITGGDRTNTVESVRIAAAAGDYAVIVRGRDVAYDSAKGGAAAVYVRGAFADEDEARQSLEIAASEPSGENVAMSVGETNVFGVTVTTSSNVVPEYAWTVDGVTVSGETTNRFVYGTTWTDHGRHAVRVIATAAGGLYASREWTVTVRGVMRVDATAGDDATATGSPDLPYATISAALATAVEGDALSVGPGAYAGGLSVPAGVASIVATAGPEATVIDGGGTNRCFDATRSMATVLAGFTLTNGWVNATNAYGYGAGAYGGNLTNCVVVGCRVGGGGAYGGGAARATLVDCRIEDCCADNGGGGLYDCTASFCLIRGNCNFYSDAYGGGGAANSRLVHCTVCGNASGQAAGGVDGDCVCTNSIVWGNVLFNGETSNWESYVLSGATNRTSFAFSCTTPAGYADGGGNTNAAPRWVNADKGDFRLVVNSPCLGTANDGLNMGAWQGEAVPGYVIVATTDGPGEVTPSEVFVAEGESVAFTATLHHPFFGWTTNGVHAADAETNVFVWADVRADGSIVAIFGSTNFFVDATTGDDASNGWSWAEAKQTIQAAVDVAGNGERVSVGPGTYAGLEASPSRLDIVAVAGPEVTILDGGNTNRCYDGYASQTTLLRGFTLVNGASADNYGGGVLYGTLSNCVIRSCSALKGGGGACAATLTDCVIADCETDGQGGGACVSTLVSCTVRGNRAKTYYRSYYSYFAGGGIDYQCEALNTIVWGNLGPDGLSDDFEALDDFYRGYGWVTLAPSLYVCCSPLISPYGSGSITNDPRFVSEAVSDPRLYEISPCIGAGYGGANIGAYRGAGVVKALPAIDIATASGEEVSNAVASVGYVDPGVAQAIGTNAETYAAFQAWSTNGFKSTAVVFSSRAADSFLVREIVAAPTLLGEGNETSVELTALEPASDGTCSTTVRLMDGENAVPLCAVKAAFAKRTQVGTEPDALAPADADNVVAEPVDGGLAVKLTVTPPSQTMRYFMRFVLR